MHKVEYRPTIPRFTPEEQTFWAEFATATWERATLSTADSPFQLRATEEELLLALADLAENKPVATKDSAGLVGTAVSLDGNTVRIDRGEFLPQRSDSSLESYLNRVDSARAGNDWLVAGYGLHTVSPVFWDEAKRLSDILQHATGARPAGRVDVDTFIGRYACTNVGVHADNAANFGFTLRGDKRMLAWPAELSASVPQFTKDYGRARRWADVLTGRPGWMSYFPSSYLHVGECPGEPSASVNITFFTETDPFAEIIDMVERQARGYSLDTAVTPPAGHGGVSVPGLSLEAYDKVAAVVSGSLIRDAITSSWLRKVTSSCLGVGRPVESADPVGDATVFLAGNATVAWHDAVTGEAVLISSNGHVMRLASEPYLIELMAELDSGAEVSVADCYAKAAKERPGQDRDYQVKLIQAALYRLRTWKAIEVKG